MLPYLHENYFLKRYFILKHIAYRRLYKTYMPVKEQQSVTSAQFRK